MRFLLVDSDEVVVCCSLFDFLLQIEFMRMIWLIESWRKVNLQFYEFDEYDNEIKVELDFSNIMDVLCRFKMYINCLYNDILYERDEFKYLKKRVLRLGIK